MKNLITILTLIFTITAVSPYAEAKKFGGGKSFGKHYNTAPTKKQNSSQSSTNKQSQQAEQPKSKGFMGGMLGGLLAGGILGSLFGGSFGGGGGGMMVILILALLAFVAFKAIKLMRNMKTSQAPSQEEYATNSYQPTSEQLREYDNNDFASTSSTIASETQKPLINLPANFNEKCCLTDACNHYRIIQNAWDQNDFSKIKEYVAPDLIEDLRAERNKLTYTQTTEVLYVDAEIVRADYDEEKAQLSIKFFGRCKEHNEEEKNIDDIWHLERDLKTQNSPWLIVGIH